MCECSMYCICVTGSVSFCLISVPTSDRQIEKEDLAKYVSNKREMFLVQYSLGVKREEIRKLEQIAKVGAVCVCHVHVCVCALHCSL